MPFTFEPGGWYAMTMYPGYGGMPYRSPIEVHAVRPLGYGKFNLDFWNVGYADGVSQMEKHFRTLQRSDHAIVTQEVNAKDRITIFEPLTMAWVSAFAPSFGTMLITALQRRTVIGLFKP